MTKFLQSLRGDTSGLALIEFAFSLPIILTMGLGGVELAHMAIATERVGQIAMLVADNAGRVRNTIDELDVNEIMTGAKLMGADIQFSTNGRIILSNIQNNPTNTGQWIRWQRCKGAKNVAPGYGNVNDGWLDSSLSAGVFDHVGSSPKLSAAPGTIVMMVEVVYDYQPIVPITNYFGILPPGLFTAKAMRVVQAFNVRDRAPASSTLANGAADPAPPSDIKNQSNLTGANVSSCGLFSA